MNQNSRYILYGAEFSLYSGKARAYLRYKGVDYRERLATLRRFKKVIVPNTGVRFIPVVATPDGQYIQDTTEIIDALEARFPERVVYPPTARQRIAAKLLELYADEWLLIVAMHYRWHFAQRNQAFILAEFGRLAAPWAPAWLRRMLAGRQAGRFAAMLPTLGIDADTAPAIEAWYLETLDALQTHFSHHRYLFGARASIADFGLIGPLYAHLYRDPEPGRIMRAYAPAVVAWVERMFETRPEIGPWTADDAVPDSLQPLFQRQFAEQFPVLRETVAAVAAWVAAHPGKRLPRRIGRHRFRIGEAASERALMPYPQWMLQRIVDDYAGLPDAERARVDTWIDAWGGRSALSMPIPQRLARRDNLLWPTTATSDDRRPPASHNP